MKPLPPSQKLPTLSVIRKVFSLLKVWEKIIILVLVLLACFALAMVGKNVYLENSVLEPKPGGVVTYGLVGQPDVLNPVLASDKTDQTINRLVFSSLYSYNLQGELVPDLAKSLPEISEDGKTFEVALDKDRLWHDGVPITTKDVLYTISKIQDPEIQSPLRNLWQYTEVKAKDLNSLTFTLKEANAAFPHNLTFGLLPEHIWRGVRSDAFSSSPLNQKPLGSGAFSIRQIRREKTGKAVEIQMEKFAGTGKPALVQSLNVKFFDTEQDLVSAIKRNAVMAGTVNPLNVEEPNISIDQYKAKNFYTTYQGVYFNTTSNLLSNTKARRALAGSVDWQAIIELWSNSIRPISGAPLGLIQEPFTEYYQVSEPLKLLREAGYSTSSSGKLFKNGQVAKLSIFAPETLPYPQVVQKFSSFWENLGFEVETKTLPTDQLVEQIIRPRNFDILIFSQTTGADKDSFPYWHSSQTQDPGINITQFSSPEADQLLTLGRAAVDPDVRFEKYAKLEQLLKTEVPAIFYGQNGSLILASSNIQGIQNAFLPDHTWQLLQVNNWYLKTERVLHKKTSP